MQKIIKKQKITKKIQQNAKMLKIIQKSQEVQKKKIQKITRNVKIIENVEYHQKCQISPKNKKITSTIN